MLLRRRVRRPRVYRRWHSLPRYAFRTTGPAVRNGVRGRLASISPPHWVRGLLLCRRRVWLYPAC